MSKADKMLEELGFKIVNEPQFLEPISNDYYSEGDIVYEYHHNNKVTCRLYFIDKQIGNNYPTGYCDEHHYSVYLAIHEKMKELGWLNNIDE